jgi:hypothetical protein
MTASRAKAGRRAPSGDTAGRSFEISPRRQTKAGRFCKLKTLGSIAVRQESPSRVNLLVCNSNSLVAMTCEEQTLAFYSPAWITG